MEVLNGTGNGTIKTQKSVRNLFHVLLKQVLDYKFFFLLSISVSLVLAYLSIRYTTPVYLVRTSVLIKETKNPSSNPQNLLYSEGGDGGADPIRISEEVAILQSYPFIYRTLDSLNMRVAYFRQGNLQKEEVYDLPYKITFPNPDLFQTLIDRAFAVTFYDSSHFSLREAPMPSAAKTAKTYTIGDTILIDSCPIVLKGKEGAVHSRSVSPNFEFRVNNLQALAFQFKSQLNIRTNAMENSILDIYLATTVPQKGIDFLNEYAKQYLNYKYEEKSRAVSQGLAFINNQLDAISSQLGSTEGHLEKFKTTNTYSDASRMTERALDALSDLDKDRASLALNEKYYDAMLRNLAENKGAEQLVAPSSIGIEDKQTDGLVNQLLILQMEKNSFHDEGGSKNPLVKDIDAKISTIRNTLKANLSSLLNNNRVKLAEVNAKANQHQASVNNLPQAERKFVDINRENSLNEQIYLFLSQKKLEAGILKAATTVENKIIESAMLDSPIPLKPKRSNNYAVALLVGVVFPFGWLWLKILFNKKVSGRQEFQNLVSIPYIGTIYHNFDNATQVIKPGSRTAISESFRLLRSYLTAINSDNGSRAILITSMDSGEGKSFSAVNIAASFALIKKKTILVNLDLHAQNNNDPYKENGPGMSAYLNESALLEEIINHTENPYFDYIPSGEIQSHASELLNDEKVATLLRALKKNYTYIIIDCSPLGKVADPFIVTKYTNINLIVVRLNYTTKEMLFDLEQLYKDGKLKNAGIVLNDERLEKSAYKNKYYHENKLAPKKFSLNLFKLL